MKPVLLFGLLTAAACVPDLGGDDSQVTTARVLAVRADPAEARPGAKVTFSTLVAGPQGTIASPAIAWSFCTAPKPLTDDNVVSDACLDASSLTAAGTGGSVTASTPSNGCSLFGPETPSTGGFRPQDPDGTGGYYQPLRADLRGADETFELVRIECDLANASAAAVAQFASAYRTNQNPALAPLTAAIGGVPVTLDAVPSSARIVFAASWSAADAETYAYFDPASQTVTSKRESMQVAWYATTGGFDTESTGRSEDDLATSTTNGWRAPSGPGPVHLWVVLRDSRGGVDFASVQVTVAR